MEKNQLELFHLAPRDEGKPKVNWIDGGLTSLHIERLKRFNSFDVDFERITLLVGSNSSGKTTILQAVRLFYWCIGKCIRQYESGYKLFKAVIPFSDFHLIPAHELRELSYRGISANSRTRGIVIEGVLGTGLRLAFRIYSSYSTLMVVSPEVQPDDLFTGEQVEQINRPPLYIPGFFGVVTREVLAHDARLEQLLNSGHHNEVLRNIILRLRGEPTRLERLLNIMKQEFSVAGMDLPFSEKVTEFLRAEYHEHGNRIPLDFVSAGSGFLQVLQIMAHALQNPSPLLLLDEPDAHMHHGLQKAFLNVLRSFADTEKLQVLMASHSETFIREMALGEIRVINSEAPKAAKVPNELDLQEQLAEACIWPSHLELAEILRTRRVLLVEGVEDERAVHTAGRLKYNDWDNKSRLVQIVFTDGSDDNTVRRLEYVREILSRLLPDGVRVAHLRDRDLLCDAAIKTLRDEAKKKKLPLFLTERRNLEAYMVEPALVERALRKLEINLPKELLTEGSIAEFVITTIFEWCNEQLDEIPVKVKEYNQSWVRRTYELDNFKKGNVEVETFLRQSWHEPINKKTLPWKLVDGKAVLRMLRSKLQVHKLHLSDDIIIKAMSLTDFDHAVTQSVEEVYSWF